VLAGGFLAIRGRHAYGTYVLAEPDGALHLHDKDIPTAWEQHYYRGGDDPGVAQCATLGCTVGLMSGWEWARNRTAARVRAAGAGLVLGGMCWPSMPLNWPWPLSLWTAREHAIWRRQACELPGQVARLTGAPVAHASHVGPIEGETPLGPGIPWRTEMLGESQICDRRGEILARMTLEDGEGHVSAEVELQAPEPLEPIAQRYWIPKMTATTHLAWHTMNAHGALSYRVRHARKRFGWQSWPAGDLPDHNPPADPAEAPAATSN
jgi:predicted amidohydrolase